MIEKINEDFLKAFKEKDTFKKNFLGLIKGEIQNETKRGTGEVDVMAILKKMEKSLKTTNDTEAQKQLIILQEYLPVMMDEKSIHQIISGYKHAGMDNFGAMMGLFNKNYKGKADNNLVSAIIREILA
jgi:uncharacterized protein YqeY